MLEKCQIGISIIQIGCISRKIMNYIIYSHIQTNKISWICPRFENKIRFCVVIFNCDFQYQTVWIRRLGSGRDFLPIDILWKSSLNVIWERVWFACKLWNNIQLRKAINISPIVSSVLFIFSFNQIRCPDLAHDGCYTIAIIYKVYGSIFWYKCIIYTIYLKGSETALVIWISGFHMESNSIKRTSLLFKRSSLQLKHSSYSIQRNSKNLIWIDMSTSKSSCAMSTELTPRSWIRIKTSVGFEGFGDVHLS